MAQVLGRDVGAAAMIIRKLYDRICSRLLEPGGLVLGIVAEQDFLNSYTSVMNDFLSRTGLIRRFAVMRLDYGVAQYRYPDWLAIADAVFVDEQAVFKSQIGEWGAQIQFTNEVGEVQAWAQDRQEDTQFTLRPAPAAQGQVITAGASGDFGSVAAPMLTGDGGATPSFAERTYVEDPGSLLTGIEAWVGSAGNVTVLGTAALYNEDPDLDDEVEGMALPFMLYIGYGILAKIFSTDGEAKDTQRAKYCIARYDEGIKLGSRLAGEDES